MQPPSRTNNVIAEMLNWLDKYVKNAGQIRGQARMALR